MDKTWWKGISPSRIYEKKKKKKEKKYPLNERKKENKRGMQRWKTEENKSFSLSLSLLIFTVTNLSFRSVKEEDGRGLRSPKLQG